MTTSYLAWAKTTLEDTGVPLNLVNSGYPSRELEDLSLPFPDESILRAPNANGWNPLMSALGESYDLSRDTITVTAGATMANYLVLKSWIRPGDPILIESPSYQPIYHAAENLGATIFPLHRSFQDHWQLSWSALHLALETHRPKAVVITSPHNPSGRPETAAELARLANSVAACGSHLIVDTVYADYFNWNPKDLRKSIEDGNLTVTSSLTKVLGFGPLRVGWIASAIPHTQTYKTGVDQVFGCHGGINERLGLACWQERGRFIEEARRRVAFNREVLMRFLSTEPALEWFDPGGGPLAFIRLRGNPNSASFCAELRNRGVAVVPGYFFDAPAFFRVGLAGKPMEFRQALREMGRILPDFTGESVCHSG